MFDWYWRNWTLPALAVVVLLVISGGLYWWMSGPSVPGPTEQALPEEKVELYLYNEPDYRLEIVRRKVPEASSKSHRVRQIVDKLAESPPENRLVSLAPDALELRSVYMDGEIVYLDFNDELIGAAEGSSGEMMFLYSIVNSVLANLPDKYKLVHFLVEGEMRKTIGPYGEESGHIAIQYPLGPRWNLTESS